MIRKVPDQNPQNSSNFRTDKLFYTIYILSRIFFCFSLFSVGYLIPHFALESFVEFCEIFLKSESEEFRNFSGSAEFQN